METTQNFSIKRLSLMLQKDVFDNFTYVLAGYGSVIGLFLFIFLGFLVQGIPIENYAKFYTFGLTVVGVLIAGLAFNDFRVKEKSMNYLTLPASLLEKFLSMLILTTIGVAASFTVVFYIFNGLAYLIGLLMFDIEPNFLNILDKEILSHILWVFSVQSIFLVGAVTFKKAPLFLTLLAIFIVGFVLLIYSGILSFTLYKEMIFGAAQGGTYNVMVGGDEIETGKTTIDIIGNVLKYCMAPFFWVVAYLKMKEKEV